MQLIFKILIIIFFTSSAISEDNEKFLMLKNDKVNVRYGPSFDYPIKYIYKKINLPLKVIDKQENFITVKTGDVKLILCNEKYFKERYNYFGKHIKIRKEMFGSFTLRTSSMFFLRKINQINFPNILKFEHENKIQILLREYNFILEFKKN